MTTPTATMAHVTYRNDYQPSHYLINTVNLQFDFNEDVTVVTSEISIRKNPDVTKQAPLVLVGDGLQFVSISLDGQELASNAYTVTSDELVLLDPPETAVLQIVTQIKPQDNTQLMGIYKSGGNFCSQCESEGFRRITYYLDRPDVMASFTTKIIADAKRYPILLSNGNLIDSGSLPKGRHFAIWQDPFKKPCYLFALVAGDLQCVKGDYTTLTGRNIDLRIYVQEGNEDKCAHALKSLQEAMRWDEETFGREYDLDIYMIVAVDDFNYGAMENKGLNIFNAKYILASPATGTDQDFTAIGTVVGHEYFHNWTGNRITCRDWFQLSLKEGLTVFRDQEFTAAVNLRNLKRIQDVTRLRNYQFPQDAGPMAHSVRPDSYMEINNFYTATVYEKGAELYRMLQTIFGDKGFRKGMDLYFERHDGQAAVCEDVVAAMQDANKFNLQQFMLWYSQAGTPELTITAEYDATNKRYILHCQQSCPATPHQPEKKPFLIPLRVGLLSPQGQDMPLQLSNESSAAATTRVLLLTKSSETFEFINIAEKPTPSLLRGFSAPVKLKFDYSEQDLLFLLAHDSDAFCRWDAGQQLILRNILYLVKEQQANNALTIDSKIISAYQNILTSRELDKLFIAEVISFPSEAYIANNVSVIDPVAIHQVRQFLRREFAEKSLEQLQTVYQENCVSKPYQFDYENLAQRSLKNTVLSYLACLQSDNALQLARQQLQQTDNMTDKLAALGVIKDYANNTRDQLFDEFYEMWQEDTLVLDKWFMLQALSDLPDTVERVNRLRQHPKFNFKNPNKVRALIGNFSALNHYHFHRADGAGYRLLTEVVLQLEPYNSMTASRLLEPFTQWRRYDSQRQQLMRAQLERVINREKVAPDVYEVVSKSLEG